MLGSEYNWLLSLSRQRDGTPRVRMAGTVLTTLAIALFCVACLALRAEPTPRDLLREAAAAGQAGDHSLLIAKLEAARALRPDYPRVLSSLARAYAAAGRPADALAQLRELAALGLDLDPAADPALARLRDQPGFAPVQAAFAANRAPAGRDETAWAVTGVDGIIEGLACQPSNLHWYFSDVRNRCLWHRDVTGGTAQTVKFSSDADRLLGVFGLKIDEPHGAVWAATAAVPEMKGYTAADQGRAALVEFDLATGRVRRSFPVPSDGRNHVLGDLLLAPDGGVFTSDSAAPVIWRLPPGGNRLEKWLESEEFVSLQGLAFAADGRSLIVADYANGLWRIDLATRVRTLLPAPAHATLFGIDGLYAVPGGLVAVQNGLAPQRIIRIALDSSGRPQGVKVLLAGHAAMSDLALGEIVHGRLHFVGNSGWALFDDPKAAPAARTVTILSTATD